MPVDADGPAFSLLGDDLTNVGEDDLLALGVESPKQAHPRTGDSFQREDTRVVFFEKRSKRLFHQASNVRDDAVSGLRVTLL